MGCVPVSLRLVHLKWDLVSGNLSGSRDTHRHNPLAKSVQFIMGNDIAGGRVLPILEVLEEFPWVFSSAWCYTGTVPTVE